MEDKKAGFVILLVDYWLPSSVIPYIESFLKNRIGREKSNSRFEDCWFKSETISQSTLAAVDFAWY